MKSRQTTPSHKPASSSGARLVWLAGLGVIAVSFRCSRRVLRDVMAAGQTTAIFAKEVVKDFAAHLSGFGVIVHDAAMHRRRRRTH